MTASSSQETASTARAPAGTSPQLTVQREAPTSLHGLVCRGDGLLGPTQTKQRLGQPLIGQRITVALGDQDTQELGRPFGIALEQVGRRYNPSAHGVTSARGMLPGQGQIERPQRELCGKPGAPSKS